MIKTFYGYEIKRISKRSNFRVTTPDGTTWTSTFRTFKKAVREIRSVEGDFDQVSFPL